MGAATGLDMVTSFRLPIRAPYCFLSQAQAHLTGRGEAGFAGVGAGAAAAIAAVYTGAHCG